MKTLFRRIMLFCSAVFLGCRGASAAGFNPLAISLGTPNYSGSADSLHDLHDNILVYALGTIDICSAVAGIVVIISALQIYFKMQNGEEGVMKSIQRLFWSCIFLLAAWIIFPALFGYDMIHLKNPDIHHFHF